MEKNAGGKEEKWGGGGEAREVYDVERRVKVARRKSGGEGGGENESIRT